MSRLLALALLVGCASPVADEGAGAPPDEPAEDGPIFEDASADVGLLFEHRNGMSGQTYYNEIMGAGAALFDADGDGDLDAYLVQGEPQGPAEAEQGPSGDRLFRNLLVEEGSLRFEDHTAGAGLEGLGGYGMGVATGDFDNDGRVDLYITNYGPNRLLRNLGDRDSGGGSGWIAFEDVTTERGADDGRWSTGAAFVDVDADGWLDLYVVNYVDFRLDDHRFCRSPTGRRDYCGPHNYVGVADRLLRNRGDGTFEDVSAEMGLLARPRAGLGVVSGDFDADGRLDLYVANDLERNFLWLGRRDGFSDQALLRGCAVNADGRSEASMGLEAADLDNDGDEDLFSTHLRNETHTLYRNDGSGFFADHTSASGVGPPSVELTGFGTAAVDLDHDGRLDLVVVNGAVTVLEDLALAGDPFPLGQVNQVFSNVGGGRLSLLTPEQAGATFDQRRVSRGLAVGDVDNDGDMDLLVSNNHGPAQLLLNRIGRDRPWIGLRLVGGSELGGRDVLGATATVLPSSVHRSSGGSASAPSAPLWRRVRTDGSYASARDPRLHFGLGSWEDPGGSVDVEVRWPEGRLERWTGLEPGRYHTLEKGRGESRVLP
ncbi:MAG: CRTAC1 family protein [Holophagales bacterium]|nr:CRTAC1 family protein [Holophagales bacterium]